MRFWPKLSWVQGHDGQPFLYNPEIERPHVHIMEVRDVQPGMRQPLTSGTTIVLYGCRTCPHVESQTVQGVWSREQVMGASNATS